MMTFSGRAPSQREDELQKFIGVLQRLDCKSYLEIGARHGDTFHAVMSTLSVGAYGVAVDLPGGAWGQHDTQVVLNQACNDLRGAGYNAHMILGDSAEIEVVEWIGHHAAAIWKNSQEGGIETGTSISVFDACLIDGDHRYDAVMRDFNNYSKMARVVALHDIDGHGQVQKTSKLPVEVPKAWAEIKAMGYPTLEIIGARRGMGIGLVCMDPALASLFEEMTND